MTPSPGSPSDVQPSPPPPPTPRWQRNQLTGLDALAEHVREFAFDLVPLDTGEATIEVTRIYLDRLVLMVGYGDFPRHSVRAATEVPALIVGMDIEGEAFWDGHAIDDRSVVSLAERSELVGRSGGRVGWASLFWDAEFVGSYASALGIAPHEVTRANVKSAIPEDVGALRRAIGYVLDTAARDPAGIEVPAVRRRLEDSLVMAGVGALHPIRDDRSVAAVSHVRAVRAAFDVLEARSGEPIYLAELCVAADVSERTLRSAFQHLYGVSPIRYLTLRRMELVRRALRNADPCATRVSTIASRFGFTNLGRFAAEFRRLYGESPLQTLRGT